ncbi:acyl-CoA desaturase [Penicillium taxi]|uniref:acyl-CoA desaturase n=1 Tax=Penicillium taxi TaxID=168475 RepID=UPI00254566C4|nr:acyl-CoA desaturase [Penicillium taxi]KAJ5907785.1 acyl-CoA desaturase [Penicillium taxi]
MHTEMNIPTMQASNDEISTVHSVQDSVQDSVEEENTMKWYEKIHWLKMTVVVIFPLLATFSTFWVPLQRKTTIFAIGYSFLKGISITTGYHRLWSHKSFSAGKPLQIFLALFGAGAGQGSIKVWCREHRAHHRYVDTDQDPYNVAKGLFHSHIGWIIFKQDLDRIGRVNIEDFKQDSIVQWQARYYWQLFLIMSYILPTVIAGLGWNDWYGGLIYGGLLGTAIIQQRTFCINSLAHYFGDQPYDSVKSARDNFLVALITLGEGYHNFHHEFPNDWRNGIEWYDYDPTKWLIWLCNKLGLASNLNAFPANVIQKNWLQQCQKRLDQQFQTMTWGVPLAGLPIMPWEEYTAQKTLKLILIEDIVYDITSFIEKHPGGAALIRSGVGKDATGLFNGDVYRHSQAARNLLSDKRVAVIKRADTLKI